ncbi:MAG: aspartyl protease family protein [Ardenticatenaceae bacterium]
MTTYSYLYSTTYDPPAPVIEIKVRSTGRKNFGSLTALIDSGADATMIPIDVLKQVGARYLRTLQMRGITGLASRVDTYLVVVRIGPHTIYGIRAIAMPPHSEGIIGRDVLNQLVVTLNGLATTTEIAG